MAELSSHPYNTAIVLISYGWFRKSSIWENRDYIKYWWVDRPSIRIILSFEVIEPMSYERVTDSSVWRNIDTIPFRWVIDYSVCDNVWLKKVCRGISKSPYICIPRSMFSNVIRLMVLTLLKAMYGCQATRLLLKTWWQITTIENGVEKTQWVRIVTCFWQNHPVPNTDTSCWLQTFLYIHNVVTYVHVT